MNWTKLAIILALAAMVCCAGCAKHSPARSKAVTQAQANAWVHELQPMVEDIAGRKFKKAAKVKICPADEVLKIETERMVEYYAKKQPKAVLSEIRREARIDAQAECKNMLAMSAAHNDGSVGIYLIDERIDGAMQRAGIAAEERESFIKLLLVREMAGALSDQYIDWDKGDSLTKDANNAKAAVRAGFTSFVRQAAAERLNLDGLQKNYIGYAIETTTTTQRAAKPSNIAASDRVWANVAYLDARDFIVWHKKRHGIAFIWNILENPPATSAMIFHPETYSSTIPQSEEYGRALDGLEKRFGSRKWKSERISEGAISARQIGATVPQKKLADAFQHTDYMHQLYMEDGDAYVTVNVILMDSKEAALAILDQLNLINSDSLSQRTKHKPQVASYTGIKADKATMATTKNGEKITRKNLKVVRGRLLIDIKIKDVAMSDSTIAAVAEDIFKNAPKAAN